MPDISELFTIETEQFSVQKLLETEIGGFSLGNLLAAAVILLISLVVIKLLTKAVRRALERSKLERAIRSFILSCVRVLLWVLVALIIADKLSIPSASLVAVLSVAGLAFSLSLQNTLSNVFAGFTLLMTRPFSSGDFVELGATTGTVISSGLFYVTLVTADRKEIHIPNSDVAASRITNYSTEPTRRVDLAFGLEYSCDAESVRRALLNAAAADARVLTEPAPSVVVSAYKASSVEYSLRAWAATQDYWDVYFALNENCRTALEKAGLSMAFDRLDVRILDNK